jgi:hypothetical protein
MVSLKTSRKRLGRALGLVALGLTLLVGSAGYGLMPVSQAVITDSPSLVECKVTILRGDVSIKRVSEGSDVWEELKEGDRVREGDEIITHRNGRVLIVCGCVQVQIYEDSHTKLERLDLAEGEARQIYGVSLSKLERCPVGTAYRVMTPRGTAVVRGTLFKVAHDREADLTEVVVVKDTVEVTTLPTGKNRVTLTGPGSCDKGGLRVTIDKSENISEPQLVPIDKEEWKIESADGSKKVDFCK